MFYLPIVLIIFTYVAFAIWINFRQIKVINKSYDKVPEDFIDTIPIDKHQKAAKYSISKIKLDNYHIVYSTLIVFIWIFFDGLLYLNNILSNFIDNPIILGTTFITLFYVISTILEIPFSYWKNFKIEKSFGFNKMTKTTFTTDIIKELIISIVFIIPLVAIVLTIINNLTSWSLYVWGVIVLFSILISWIYPAFIAPIFNKFTKLDNKELVLKIKSLLKKTGFKSNGIFVIDGSKRTSHGNAYFTGIGNKKRIVFFDTLLKSMSDDEIEAILAHELGHFHHKHVFKLMIISMIIMLVSLVTLDFLMSQKIFYQIFNIKEGNIHIALIIFSLLLPIFSFFVIPILKKLSRKFEYQADLFAVKNSNVDNLISALVKLYKDNAVSLNSDKIYSAFYDSHPSAIIRINALKNIC